MFDIRIICQPEDLEHITQSLRGTFTLGNSQSRPTRDGKRLRVYLRAEHRTEAGNWPEPEDAYRDAPSITSEIGWVAGAAAGDEFGCPLDREFWLRKAALLDRIALQDWLEADEPPQETSELAQQAGQLLMDADAVASLSDPRRYVRQQYADWINTQ